jgi:hypothetical protein
MSGPLDESDAVRRERRNAGPELVGDSVDGFPERGVLEADRDFALGPGGATIDETGVAGLLANRAQNLGDVVCLLGKRHGPRSQILGRFGRCGDRQQEGREEGVHGGHYNRCRGAAHFFFAASQSGP